jgi:hypothetical protein
MTTPVGVCEKEQKIVCHEVLKVWSVQRQNADFNTTEIRIFLYEKTLTQMMTKIYIGHFNFTLNVQAKVLL